MRRMSIVGVAALSVLALLPAAPVRADGVSAYHVAEQAADASWIVRENGSKSLYFALAFRGTETLMAPMGVVGRGDCSSGGGWTFCFASGRAHELSDEDFVFDPGMDGAFMRIRTAKERHVVAWTGEDLVYPGVGAQAGLAYAAAAGGVWRPASVEAELYGRSFDSRGSFFSGLSQHVLAFAEYYGERGYTFHDDGTVSLRLRFRK